MVYFFSPNVDCLRQWFKCDLQPRREARCGGRWGRLRGLNVVDLRHVGRRLQRLGLVFKNWMRILTEIKFTNCTKVHLNRRTQDRIVLNTPSLMLLRGRVGSIGLVHLAVYKLWSLKKVLVGIVRLLTSNEIFTRNVNNARTCVPVPALLVTESFLAAPEWSLTTIVVFVDSPDWSCCWVDEVERFIWLDLTF